MWLHLVAVCVGVAFGLWLMADDNLDSLKGKRVLITGASGGIGEQLAYEYAKQGANVVVTARRQAELKKVSDKCRTLSPSNASHIAVPADMKDFNSIQHLVKKATESLGGLDIVVINHISLSDIDTFTGSHKNLEDFYRIMDINFKSYVQLAALALPYLTESQGNLVVINSLMGFSKNPKLASYAASKFALNGFFGSLRSQFIMEQRNVAVTSCVLGYIDTPNAVKGLKDSGSSRILRFVTPASAKGAAQAIVGGSARRADVVYYPNISNQVYLWVQKFFPSFIDFVIREMARR